MESTRSRCARARADLYCPTADDLLEPYRKYPPVIQAAILAVDTAPQFINLTRGQKAVLRLLLSRAQRDNGEQPVQVKFEDAAAEIGVSTKTIARTVALLADIGWLVRLETPRDAYGTFAYREFRFTPALCSLVGLPVLSRRHRTSVSRPVNKDRSSKEDQLEIRATAREETPEIDLPPELQALVQQLEIKDTGIANLRGQASRAGHKLIDIVACARAHLVKLQLRGNRAFRYLERMCGWHGDYAARAAYLVAQDHKQEQAIRGRDREQRYAGRCFARDDGLIVRVLDGMAELWRGKEPAGGLARRDLPLVFDAIERGQLQEIILSNQL